MDRYDIIAIGGGAAGLVTAAGAAGLGAKTALIERHRMGGECLWTGCVPSKALIAAARALSNIRNASSYGVNAAGVSVDFAGVMAHVHAAQHTIAPNDSPERFRNLGVDVMRGNALFMDPATLLVDARRLTARHFVIATGSRPTIPDIPGLRDVSFLTNENVFSLEELPETLIVLGGGAIGVELAQAFAILGSNVTLIEAEERVLRNEDRELVDLLVERLEADGIRLHTGVAASGVAKTANGIRVTTARGDFEAAALLVAVGRTANTDTLHLDNAGVTYTRGGLELDKYLRTNIHNIWGAGDVTGAPRFTHVADYQARLVLRNALFPGRSAVDYTNIPWATYTDPELARIGLTENEARERHGDSVRVFRKPFAELDRAIADGSTVGLTKIVADKRGKILGAHILGGQASSLLGEIALAMKHDISLSTLSSTMHAYPTYPEAIKHMGDAFVRGGFTGLKKRAANWLVRRAR